VVLLARHTGGQRVTTTVAGIDLTGHDACSTQHTADMHTGQVTLNLEGLLQDVAPADKALRPLGSRVEA
jgi:hypothetical protein